MSIQSQECATFTLRTSDLPTYAAGANANGSTNDAAHSSFTWNNIDIKSILGEMWYKYEYFNIALVSNVSSPVTITYAANDNRINMINMSGLKWVNANYDTGTKTYTNNAPIGSINFSTLTGTVAAINQYNTLFFNTFGKSEPVRSLTIAYKKISDNASPTTSSGVFPPTVFLFKVYGVRIDNKVDANKLVVN